MINTVMQNNMTLLEMRSIIEGASKHEKLILEPLSYKLDDLVPILSKEIVDYHYNFLSRGYVDRYNKKEGNADFNAAGAYLHNLFWAQFLPYKEKTQPQGPALTLLNRVYGSFDKFLDEFIEKAASIEGSGWCYVSKQGEIKLIHNHQIKKDIAFVCDLWEHSCVEYGKNKKKYLRDIWKIVDWSIFAARL